jgi:hypothetical protein
LIEIAEADEKALDDAKEKESRGLPGKRNVTSAGGAIMLESSELEEARTTGLLTAGRQLSRAVQIAIQTLSCSGNTLSNDFNDAFANYWFYFTLPFSS